MQSNATNQQQQVYQKKLLQHQQQQMSQFHMSASMDPSLQLVQSPIAMGTSSQQGPSGAPFSLNSRHALPTSIINSRMGPPNHLGQGMGIPVLPIQQQSSSSSNSESTSHFGPGAGLARLHQYSEALKEGPDRHSSEYWKSFVEEFFLPESTLHLVLWNPSTHEHKGFEVPASVVARWMQTNYISGVTSSTMSLESPREYMSGQPFPPPPRSIRADFHLPSGNVTHFVECKRSLLINNFDNGWQVQMTGLLRAAFVPHTRVLPPSANSVKDESPTLQTHLRFECLELLITNHRSFVPSSSSFIKSQEEQIPSSVIRSILASHGLGTSDSKQTEEINNTKDPKSTKTEDNLIGEEQDKTDFSIKVNQLCLPDSPVNEYGITLRAMRCLEITESVCQLRDLMDFSMREKERQLGPIDGLRRLTAQYRERENQIQRLGMTPSNALQFDPNTNRINTGNEDHNVKQRKVPQMESNPLALGGMGEGGSAVGQNGRVSGGPAPSPKPVSSPSKRQR